MSHEQAPNAFQAMRPDEVVERRREQMPNEVFQSFNELIAESLSNGRAIVRQDDVVARMTNAGLNKNEIYAKHWLDVEDIYREAGWRVEYWQPGYNEDGYAYFTFKDPKVYGGRHTS